LTATFDSELKFGDDIHVVDFISDIHLSETMPATAAAWEAYMAAHEGRRGLPARRHLRGVGRRRRAHAPVRGALHGGHRRDGRARAGLAAARQPRLPDRRRVRAAAGARLLADPAVGHRVRPHAAADARRRAVRRRRAVPDLPPAGARPGVPAAVPAQPLEARLALAAKMRAASMARHDEPVTYADVDETMAKDWLARLGTDTMIHGHTHRPGTQVRDGWTRHVLSDWDQDADARGPARAGAALDGRRLRAPGARTRAT
jgi:UDP-2,3-diacylglucosamine hydrolase